MNDSITEKGRVLVMVCAGIVHVVEVSVLRGRVMKEAVVVADVKKTRC